MTQPSLICLLPVRNGERELPGYLDCVARFVDGVVALDDGSTDATSSILSSHRLVREVLVNPARPGSPGCDDEANRNRLLAAAVALAPDWILSLDVDERMDEEDGLALRSMIEGPGRPGYGYLLARFAMTGDGEQCGADPLWVRRLFDHRPGQRLSRALLHGKEIHDIPRRRWIKTTLRIRHFGALTDPLRIVPWRQRPPELPALRRGAYRAAPDPPAPAAQPTITAIVIAANDERRIESALQALVTQEGLPEGGLEVVVVCSGTDATAAIVHDRFPQVTLIELERPALPGAARNAGLRIARGRYVSFPGSHVTVCAGALAARVHAHERGYAMVMGSMANGTHTPAGWASYLLDNHTALPGRSPGPLLDPPVRCSYLRAALDRCGWFPEHQRTAEDTMVNARLVRIGYGAYREPAAASIHFSPCDTPARLLRHHFARGRGLARVLLDDRRAGSAIPTVSLNLACGLPWRLLLALTAAIRFGGGDRARLLGAFPLATAAAVSSWLGTAYQLVILSRGQRRGGLPPAPPAPGWRRRVAGDPDA